MKKLQQWTSSVQTSDIRQLRQVVFPVQVKHQFSRVSSSAVAIRLKYNIADGLSVSCEKLDEASMQLLSEHVAKISATSSDLNLQGESLMLAMTYQPELWEIGVLAKKV